MKIKRRNFIANSLLTTAGLYTGISTNAVGSDFGALEKAMTPPLFSEDIAFKTSLFSKHLQWLDYTNMASAAAELGFDGVEYQSSLYPLGYNLAIFNPDKFECLKVEVFDIEKIDLTHKLVI